MKASRQEYFMFMHLDLIQVEENFSRGNTYSLQPFQTRLLIEINNLMKEWFDMHKSVVEEWIVILTDFWPPAIHSDVACSSGDAKFFATRKTGLIQKLWIKLKVDNYNYNYNVDMSFSQ